MSECDQRRASIDADLGNRFVWPLARDLGIAETFRGRESSARVDNDHVLAERTRHRHKLLRNVHGANNDEAHRGIEDIDENLAGVRGNCDALVAAKRLFERRRNGFIHVLLRTNQTLTAGSEIRDQRHLAARLNIVDQSMEQTISRGVPFHLLDEDPYRTTAGEPDLPSRVVLDAVFKSPRLAACNHFGCLSDDLRLNATPRDRTQKIAVSIDQESASHGLGG